MSRIHLHDIKVQLLPTPHHSLPADLRLAVEVLVGNVAIAKSEYAHMNPDELAWTLKVKAIVPQEIDRFLVSVTGARSSLEETSSFGSIQVQRSRVLASVDDKQRCALLLNFQQVGVDAPSLLLRAVFILQPVNPLVSLGPATTASNLQFNSESIAYIPLDSRSMTLIESLEDFTNLNQVLILELQDAVQLTPDGDPYKPSMLNNLGNTLMRHYAQCGDLSDLDNAIVTFQDCAQLVPDDHPNKPSWLSHLGYSFLARFAQQRDLADLNAAILNFQEAVRLTPDSHSDAPSWLDDLGSSLLRRFEQYGNLADLDDSTLKVQEAVRLTPDGHPDKPERLNNLGNALLTRFEQHGDLTDLNKSVLNFQTAVQLIPDVHPDKPTWLSFLGCSLLTRFAQHGDHTDLNDSILCIQKAVQLTPDDHPDKPSWLNNLGSSLLVRFEQHGNFADLDDSILKKENAVQLTPDGQPDKPIWLGSLGNSLLTRFEQLGGLTDLKESVLKMQDAAQVTPDGHPEKPSRLNNLGNALLTLFEQRGDPTDLAEAVLRFEDAVRLTPEDHPKRPSWLSNLGNSLLTTFQQIGGLADLNEAILKFQEAKKLTPEDHVEKPTRLNNLGNALLRRFEQHGDLTDLSESILNFQVSVQQTPDGHPDKSSILNNLGTSLLARFDREGDLVDLSESIAKTQSAVQLTPDSHPNKPAWLSNLGNSLLTRCGETGDLADLNDSTLSFIDAVQLAPDHHPAKPSWLSNLGNALLARFEQHQDLLDLNEAILKFREAVELTPNGHPWKPSWFNNLGRSLLIRYEQQGDLTDVKEAQTGYSTAACAPAGPASARFEASRHWAFCSHILEDFSSILQARGTSIKLLPELAWLGASVPDRHYQLTHASEVACEAAAAAFREGHYALAVEWLEQGRSVIWGQLLQLRTPLDNLKKYCPELGGRLEAISSQLEGANSPSNISDSKPISSGVLSMQSTQLSPDMTARNSHNLALERENLLAEIRKLKGFETFLLPKGLTDLTPAARSGPIIILSHSRYQNHCNALILLPHLEKEVMSLELPFTPQAASHLNSLLQEVLADGDRNIMADDTWSTSVIERDTVAKKNAIIKGLQREFEKLVDRLTKRMTSNLNADRYMVKVDEAEGLDAADPENIFQEILADLWIHVVKPVMEALAITPSHSDQKTRIWWCPTGNLCFLPFHAAGIYGADSLEHCKASDFVTPSYTPTVTALLNASKSRSPVSMWAPSDKLQLLAVAQPSSIGQVPLPGVEEELEMIRKQVGIHVRFTSLIAEQATLGRVTEEMERSNWVHFACHGVQHVSQPTESALLLTGTSRLTLSQITKLKLSDGDLAFLSACQTAKGDEYLSDEAVHLAGGMLVAGYRGVIATMWSVMDRDAPEVARDVYGHLFNQNSTGPPDPAQAAYGLQIAVQNLCNTGVPFLSWVPFVHIGI